MMRVPGDQDPNIHSYNTTNISSSRPGNQVFGSQSHGALSGSAPSTKQRLPMQSSSGTGIGMPSTGQIAAGIAMPHHGVHPGVLGDGSQNPYQVLLPPTHFASPGVSVDSPLPKNGFMGSGLNPHLNVDISSSNFMNAMNFEGLSNGSNHATGSSGNIQTRLYPPMQGYGDGTADEGEEGSQYALSDEEEQEKLEQKPNADLLEQQQAKAQAQLLDRFKQLREWQVAQQEVLMRQQQDQLTMLKQEQSRVQRMLVKQREAQWGGSQQGQPVTTQSSSPPRGSHNKPPRHPNSTLPQAIAQGTMALAKKNRYPGLDQTDGDTEAIPRPSTPVQVVKGRPLPGIVSGPSTPLEYRERGNPNLDSETNTLASGTPFEEGIARLAETASETSEGPSYFQSSATRPIEMDEPHQQEMNVPMTKFGPPIPFRIQDSSLVKNTPEMTSQQFALPPHLMPKQLPPQLYGNPLSNVQQQNYRLDMANGRVIVNQQTINLAQPKNTAPNAGQNEQNNVLDFREEPPFEEEDYQEDGESEGFNMDEDEEQEQQEEMHEDEEDGLDDAEEDTVDASTPLDNVPVAGNKKTFEQLLEEELRKEEERLMGNSGTPSNEAESGGSHKKSFLKRGEGTARFKVPVKKKAVAERKTQQSQKSGANSTNSTKTKPASNTASSKSQASSSNTNKKVLAPAPKAAPAKKVSPPNKLTLKPSQGRQSTAGDKSGAKPPSKPGPKAPSQHIKPSASQKQTSSGKTLTIGPRDSTGEKSFQQCMQHRVETEEVESEELEEFMILEQYADDNASFLSNVSAVNRVLKKEKNEDGSFPGKTKSSSQARTHATLEETLEDSSEVESDSEFDKDSDSQNDTLHEESPHLLKHISPNSKPMSGMNNNQTAQAVENDSRQQILRNIHRKVSSLGKRSPRSAEDIDEESQPQYDSEPGHSSLDHNMNIHKSNNSSDQSDSSEDEEENSSSESEEEEVNVKDIILNSNLRGPLKSQGASGSGKDPHEQNLNVGGNNNVNNLESKQSAQEVTQPKTASHGGASHEDKHLQSNNGIVDEFGDAEEWDEEEEEEETKGDTASSHTQKTLSNGPVIKTKVYPESKEDEITAGTPPTSKLVTKLFPKLKPEKPKVQVTQQQEQHLTETRQVVLGDGIQSKALREKLAELEQEIERFRKENANLEKLRKEREEGLEHIKKEMAEFEKQKQEELQRLQDFKIEETRKLKKEKRLFEQYQKAAKTMPDRKERDEIESLKKQLTDLQEELKRKEQRWTGSSKRLRDRIEALEDENTELKDEVKLMEKRRLDAWQQKEASVTTPKEGSYQSLFPTQSHSEQGSSKALPAQNRPGLAHSSQPQNNKGLSQAVPQHTGPPQPGSSHVPQPQSQASIPQPRDGHMAQGDSVLRLSCNTDDSEVPDSQSAGHLANGDHSANLNVTPQSLPQKKYTSSPLSPVSREPPVPAVGSQPSGRPNLPRKTAVAANITSAVDKGDEKYEELQHTDGKIERIYTNGAREILFSNGTRKQVSSDGQSIIVSFFNGDIKQIMPDQRVVYYYADAQTTHTTYPDGLEIIQFPNGQSEKHYPDGTKEISFPDQIIKYLFPTGIEESIFPDGTVIRLEKNGDKVMEFPNGQREVHTPQYKRREYPDGTVKTVYPDGRQETRYSSGRIRVKDKEGNIIVDRRM